MSLTRVISIVLHPFLMPVYGLMLLFSSATWLSTINDQAKYYTFLVTITTTLILPLISLYILKSRNWISDYALTDQKQRRIPLMLQSFFALLAAYILQKVSAPLVISLYFNGTSIFLLICALISFKWNISTHMAGIGGLIGLVIAVSLKWLVDLRFIIGFTILLAGILGTSRIHSKLHNPIQVYTGLLLGAGSIFALIYFI
jgi:hypothetical protein